MSQQDKWGHGFELKATAHHEAGHAVVGLYFGQLPKSVDVRREGGGLGGCDGADPPGSVLMEANVIGKARQQGRIVAGTAETKEWIENFIRSTQAGPLAEERFRGAKLDANDVGARQDKKTAEFFAAILMADMEERTRRLLELEQEVRELLQEPALWYAVQEVAQALLEQKTMSGAEVSKMPAVQALRKGTTEASLGVSEAKPAAQKGMRPKTDDECAGK
jgi:hypothetical protein